MPRHELTAPELAHLAQLRAASGAAHRATLDAGGPDPDVDLLGAIAWRSGPPEIQPFDPVLLELIDRARRLRISWAEIAAACGDSHDRGGAARVQDRQRRRARRA